MSALTTDFQATDAEVIPLDSLNAREDAAPAPRLRLTRRGRVVFGTLAVLGVAALLTLAAVFGATRASASGEASSADFGYVVVQPGDSLWSVASRLDPGADPRDVVAEIVRLNQLGGSGVQAGQPVAVPLRFADAPGVVSATELGLDDARAGQA